MTELTARELLLMLYQDALDAVDGRSLVSQWCKKNSITRHDKTAFTHCVAIGKAAAAMLQGAHDCVPSLVESLLICPPSKITRQLKKNKKITCIASSHPVPDKRSIDAGDRLTDFLSTVTATDKLLFLISGGASSLVELLVDEISLVQLQEINQYLLASGKDIHQINSWRQQFSKIKGGGLLDWVNTGSVTQLLLSDVKDDKAEFIGSGLLVESSIVPEPDSYLSAFKTNPSNKLKTSKINVDTIIIGNINLAMSAVQLAAEAEALNSIIHTDFLEGEVNEVAAQLYEELKDAPAGIHIWGGETTVCLPENPGVGGRNLTLALAFSQYLTDDLGLHLLAAGTDGVDGNANCAGAIVGVHTVKKASQMGFDISAELEKANAGIVLMATDDLVQAGNSNTNVMDIVIAYKVE
ncbi:MAG: hydroxypyruvate reductase [Gammaproteobacteria bacterium]|nr:MAG: hydroxypyruvate reductase [Gammaproteobacteria bacterium]